MKKITEFLGKPVLSLYESVTEGIVKNLVFDKAFKKLKYLVLFNDNEYQEEKMLNVNDIYSYGENAIVIKNNSCVELRISLNEETSNPINNYAYTTQGKFLGKVVDVEIDDKNNVVNILLNNNEKLDVSKVLTSGKDALFVQDEENVVKLSNFKKRTLINNDNNKTIKVQIQSSEILPLKDETNLADSEINSTITTENKTENNDENLVLPETVSPIKPHKKITLENNCLPTKVVTKNNFLIGRKVLRNIYSFNHELIIKKNCKITEKTIVTAKSHSKLKELSLYSA